MVWPMASNQLIATEKFAFDFEFLLERVLVLQDSRIHSFDNCQINMVCGDAHYHIVSDKKIPEPIVLDPHSHSTKQLAIAVAQAVKK